MKKAVRYFVMIPPWFLARLFIPFLRAGHPWHPRNRNSPLTLGSWVECGSQLSADFGTGVWGCLFSIVVVFWILFRFHNIH